MICGAGIAGISAAYFLSQRGVRDIMLIDERPPLTLTSDRSTECYRNWWPDPEMRLLMDRSIDLMEDLARASANVFRMNRRGYLYLTGDAGRLEVFRQEALRISSSGAGPLREHALGRTAYRPLLPEGFEDQPTGADLLMGGETVRVHFPYVAKTTIAALHVRRAGWLSAQQLGMHLLEQARAQGVRFLSGRVAAVDTMGGRVKAVVLDNDQRLDCDTFVNAGGPYFRQVGASAGPRSARGGRGASQGGF